MPVFAGMVFTYSWTKTRQQRTPSHQPRASPPASPRCLPPPSWPWRSKRQSIVGGWEGATFLLSVRTEATCALRLAVLPCIHAVVYHAVVRTHGLFHWGNKNMSLFMIFFPPFPRSVGLFLSLVFALGHLEPHRYCGGNASVRFCILLLETLKATIHVYARLRHTSTCLA